MRPLADIKQDYGRSVVSTDLENEIYSSVLLTRLLNDIPALVARVEALEAEREDARSALASIADAVNMWCRQVGRDSAQANQPIRHEIMTALHAVGICANEWRARWDALRTALREIADKYMSDYFDRDRAIEHMKDLARKALDGER